MRFVIFLIRWIGNNLAVPFWMVGHIHLTTSIYSDVVTILSSFGMNLLVLMALYFDWKDSNRT